MPNATRKELGIRNRYPVTLGSAAVRFDEGMRCSPGGVGVGAHASWGLVRMDSWLCGAGQQGDHIAAIKFLPRKPVKAVDVLSAKEKDAQPGVLARSVEDR